jgi:integrase
MAKRKKYPKLPNGYGSIKYLGAKRRNPYAVHPPVTEFTLDGVPKTPKALCYVDDWMVGFAVLTAYRAGTWYPGMEKELVPDKAENPSGLAQRILADYSRSKGIARAEQAKLTFSEVYEQYYEYKYVRDQSRKYSDSARSSTRAAFKNCSALHDLIFESLRHKDLQAVVDNCPKKHASLELIVTLFHQIYRYALAYEIVDRDYSAAVKINIADDDEHGVPFTEQELAILWQHEDDETVEMILIMCYSGFRISAYKSLIIDLNEEYFQGGVKTSNSKARIVPIHSAILPLVERRMGRLGFLLPMSPQSFRNRMYVLMDRLGFERRTPHDCRHTFSMLCEKYGVSENDRKRMLGHSFQRDITNAVYGHRSLEDLKAEIEKIKICY